MGKTPNTGTNKVPDTPNDSSALPLIMGMADTTWRMFAPTLPLIVIGDQLDKQYSSKPWLMLAGAVIGGLIAGWLVRQQLRKKL